LEFKFIGIILPRIQIKLALQAALAIFISVSVAPRLMSQESSSSADSDSVFARAVQDYTQNRFQDAAKEFEKVRGAQAPDAEEYLAKIKAYTEDMQLAAGIMQRPEDERDVPNLEFAIQKYQDAIRIKQDGPYEPAQKLQAARALLAKLQTTSAKGTEARDRELCAKALGAAKEHHYKDAELLICMVANDNPAYACGGDEAVHMCQQMQELASLDRQSLDSQPVPHPGTGATDSAIDKGKAAYEKNDFEKARTLFARAPADLTSAADEYLSKISRYQDLMKEAERLSQTSAYEAARVAFTNAANIKSDGPGNPAAQALLMELEAGIDQFYSGDYVAAMHNLEGYSRDGTEKEPLAHFYLGASKLARFFITGSEDASLRQSALKDLKIAKQAGYKANREDVSPKILKAYNDL
jgi:hypothetical protein